MACAAPLQRKLVVVSSGWINLCMKSDHCVVWILCVSKKTLLFTVYKTTILYIPTVSFLPLCALLNAKVCTDEYQSDSSKSASTCFDWHLVEFVKAEITGNEIKWTIDLMRFWGIRHLAKADWTWWNCVEVDCDDSCCIDLCRVQLVSNCFSNSCVIHDRKW